MFDKGIKIADMTPAKRDTLILYIDSSPPKSDSPANLISQDQKPSRTRTVTSATAPFTGVIGPCGLTMHRILFA